MKFLSILLLLSTLLLADSDKDEYREHHLPLDMRYLDLTPGQHEQVRSIVKIFKDEHKHFHRQKKTTRKSIARLFMDKSFDTGEFVRLSTALDQRAVEIQAKFFSEMYQVLTPYQRKRFVKYMEEWEVE